MMWTLLLVLAMQWQYGTPEQAVTRTPQAPLADLKVGSWAAKPGIVVPRLQLRPEVPGPFAFGDQKRDLAKPKEFQLTGPKSGVTCTLRIVPVSPSGDAGILSPAPPDRSTDPILRRDLPPCLR